MAPEKPNTSTQSSRAELDVNFNRIAIALAKREALVKSWTASSARQKEPEKTQEELDAEDAALFRPEPPYLGVGAPIPSEFLISDAERNKKTLRAKFFPKSLQASKQRDAEEKAASAKRGLNEDSSDDEGGRSSLGKAKKRKISPIPKPTIEAEDDTKLDVRNEEPKEDPVKTLGTPRITTPKTAEEQKPEEAKEKDVSGTHNNPIDGLVEDEVPSKSSEMTRKEKLKQKKKMQKKLKKQKNAAIAPAQFYS